jgi:hypothetical protein
MPMTMDLVDARATRPGLVVGTVAQTSRSDVGWRDAARPGSDHHRLGHDDSETVVEVRLASHSSRYTGVLGRCLSMFLDPATSG